MHLRVEFFALPARHAQSFPAVGAKVFRQVNNLSGVLRKVSDRAIHRMQNRVRLAANRDRLLDIFRFERADGIENNLPTLFPRPH